MNKISFSDFTALPAARAANVTEASLRLWHHIYVWAQEFGYVDLADTPQFIRYVQDLRKLSQATISRHLVAMAQAGLLKRHVLKRRLPAEARDELLDPVLGMFAGASLPTTFARFTLPGVECPREFKAAAQRAEKISKTWAAVAAESAGQNSANAP